MQSLRVPHVKLFLTCKISASTQKKCVDSVARSSMCVPFEERTQKPVMYNRSICIQREEFVECMFSAQLICVQIAHSHPRASHDPYCTGWFL